MSSFFNVERDDAGDKITRVFERDLAAWIPDLPALNPATFDPRTDVESLTDRAGEPFRHVWPNESDRVPEGVVPFEAVVVPGGFLATPRPGRLHRGCGPAVSSTLSPCPWQKSRRPCPAGQPSQPAGRLSMA
ncbi:MAG: hypothetical protein EXR82_00930 [Gammaproteobacteria bacterium]|nr:hypothetical protein [Gammaproteobacteria bacterium]